jgi:5'-nucleotidase
LTGGQGVAGSNPVAPTDVRKAPRTRCLGAFFFLSRVRVMSHPLILLSNDDGIQAAGLTALAARLADIGEVHVVAPDRERSATSHAISLDQPLRVTQMRPAWQAVSGTPADCVYLGVLKLLPRRPALVISGINHGANLGSDLFYSGTVAAAVEAAVRGIPAFAISLDAVADPDFGQAADFARSLAGAILRLGLPRHTMLNVNVPSGPSRTYAWTRLGRRVYREQVDHRVDLRGRSYFWIGGPAVASSDEPGTDCAALIEGHISVTPLDLDLTSHDLRRVLPGWDLEGFSPSAPPPAAGGARS